MSSETAIMKPRPKGLAPAEDLRRPNEHGQLPHIILTTFPDLPIAELDVDDILEINWQGVETAVRDAIVRVRHEGDLSSATLRETIQLISLALRKLESEDARLRRYVNGHPPIGRIARFVACFPGQFAAKVRKAIKALCDAEDKIDELEGVRDRLFEMRIELAEQVDESVHALLAGESEEYRQLQAQIPENDAVRSTAKGILKEIKELQELEREAADADDDGEELCGADAKRLEQIEERVDAFLEFAAEHSGKKIKDLGRAEVALRQLVAGLEAQVEPIESRMAAMCDAKKRELYSQAAESLQTVR